MNDDLSPNAQAILLLTAPLLAGKSRTSVPPLSLGDYNKLARFLHDTGMQPAALLDSDCLGEVEDAWPSFRTRRTFEQVHQLFNRGFLLSQALERWRTRAIWVVTRADADYPRRLRKKMRGKAPPVLYGCGVRDALNDGGLAVVGSRKVGGELIDYTERVGRLAAAAEVPIVSGGARGVDQAAMHGAINAGGHAVGVLGHGLERAALNRENREPLMDGRLALVSSFDPAVRFRGWQAMERNKQIYALADAALVVKSDYGFGGTWAGATEQLGKPMKSGRRSPGLHFVPVFVRGSGEPCEGLEALVELGAKQWPDLENPEQLREAVKSSGRRHAEGKRDSNGETWAPRDLFEADARRGAGASTVREPLPISDAAGCRPTTTPEQPAATKPPSSGSEDTAPNARKAADRLLPVMKGEMRRNEILRALDLKDWGNVRTRYLVPCCEKGWIEMTIPDKPGSPNQRFRLTEVGRQLLDEMGESSL